MCIGVVCSKVIVNLNYSLFSLVNNKNKSVDDFNVAILMLV